MGNPTGFLEIDKKERNYEDPKDRLKHFKEFIVPLTNEEVSKQGSRCMDCGIPYCHQGCPVNNLIPDWNDLVYKHEWKKALDTLHSTNNFPEFTGRICPAPCEAACTLNLTDNPVSIKTIECSIVDYGWEKGWIKPQLPKKHTDKKVAIIGSGPAGLACAQQLARLGHSVVVYEKNERIGGLLRIGIPDFKMEKTLIDRRMAQMQSEGVQFKTNSEIGNNISANEIIDNLTSLQQNVNFNSGAFYNLQEIVNSNNDDLQSQVNLINSIILALEENIYENIGLQNQISVMQNDINNINLLIQEIQESISQE